ncbi:MAG TPA: CPBP family intramembrane glutamic endopeptidase [Bryobacteraceae bacterium]|nr:CPBP family intramembrane glutamic endopeptidase [Bryobacteraceae bacterium]
MKDIPGWAAWPVLAAFLVEYPFYLLPAFPELRARLTGATLPPFLAISALLPYLACYLTIGHFQWIAILRLTALALALSLWYLLLPARPWSDLVFLALIAAVLIGKYFDTIYPLLYPGLNISVLGHIALIHMTALVLTVARRVEETGFGFIPSPREWRIGLLHYAGCLPVVALVAFPLKAVHLTAPAPLWKIGGTFLAFLLVVGLFEEFLVRGVLQQWMEDWTWNRTAALWLTSAIFGLAHLWFNGGGRHFPNWRWALIAAVLGWFCGHARNQAGSIRAGVVTHALVVTTWRAFFA